MSRYEIPARYPDRYTVVVGWDPMFNTFFATVHLKATSDGGTGLILWVGAGPPQIHDLEQLKRHLGMYATIPYEIELKLHKDADG